jgi:serine/threonine protein kinase/predicted esterase
MAEDFEQLLAACLQAQADHGETGVEELLAQHSEHADRLRARLDQLGRLGLLGEPETLDRVGPFRLLGQIGAGGMGVVHRARAADGHEVALKLLAPSPDARTRERFQREAASVAALDHPGIVRVVAVGEAEGRPYLALELIRGATLADLLEVLRNDPPPFEQLHGSHLARAIEVVSGEPVSGELFERSWVEAMCRIALAVAEALAHAHQHGVIHRDVKPSNVLLSTDGSVRLFDFGLAHLVDAESLTRTGDFAGTPCYTSPEQIAGRRDLDGRTDVFGLGATLYELLCLRRPFDGEGAAAVFRAIQTREPTTPRRLNPEVPADLESLCLTALAKERRHRYPGAEELAEDLRRFLTFRPVVARSAGALRRLSRVARRHPGWATAAGLMLITLIALPIVLLWVNRTIRDERDRAEESARLSAAVVEYMVGLFQGAAEEELSARELLDEGVERLPFAIEEDLLARAALFEASGRAYALMGLPREAIPLFDRAFALVSRDRGYDAAERGDSLELLARAHVATGDGETAAALCRRRLAALDAQGDGGGLRAATVRRTLGRALQVAGDLAGARRELEDALARLQQLDPGEPTAAALVDLARLDLEEGRLELAWTRVDKALSKRKRLWSPSLTAMRETLLLAAEISAAQGEHDQARDLDRRVARLELSSTEVGEPPFSYLPPWRPEFDRHFQTGISALQGARWDDARSEFEACLALSPREPVCAYNIACALARADDLDGALASLQDAARWGFGDWAGRLEIARTDPEIASVRERDGWAVLVARMEADLARAHHYSATPGWIPAAPDEPLLVVLHADGSTKDAVVAGPWGTIARERGYALLAPSAVYAAGTPPEEGMYWTQDSVGFARDPRRHAQAARDALLWLEREHGPRTGPLILAGEDVGGAIAFDLALNAPGRVRGVVLRCAAPHPRSLGARARLAEAMGLALEVVLDEDLGALGAPPSEPIEVTRERWAAWLAESWRGPAQVTVAAPGQLDTALSFAIERILAR